MKKLVSSAILVTVVLLLGTTGALRSHEAEARPTDVISFSPNICVITLIEILVNDEGESLSSAAAQAPRCFALQSPINLNFVAEVLDGADIDEALDSDLDGNVDDPDTWSVLVYRTAAQLGDNDDFGQNLWVLVFLTNDTSVHLDADEGVWASTGFTSHQTECEPEVAVGIVDEDCDDDSEWDDGVIVDLLSGANAILDPDTGIGGTGVADRGDATVTATQSGIDVEMDYVVVGMPDDLTLAATKDIIQEGAAYGDCSLADFDYAVGLPTIAGLLATVEDDDGTALTGISIRWDTDDEDTASLALWQEGPDEGELRTVSYTMATGGQVSAPNLACGQEPGEVAFTALTLDLDEDVEIDITVIGEPASITLIASPPAMICDGANSSLVTAILQDDAGNLVADGTAVHFSVQGPAVVNPIVAWTSGGEASTTVTGLSGTVLMLPVHATAGALEASIGVACTAPPPPTLLGDVNCDGQLTMADAMFIAQKVVGLIDELPCLASVAPEP